MDIYSDDGNESDNSSAVSSASTKSTLLITAHTHKSPKATVRKETPTVEYEPAYGEVDLESVHIETTVTSTTVRDRFNNGVYSYNVVSAAPDTDNSKGKKSGFMVESDSQQCVVEELQKISLELKAQSERLRQNEEAVGRKEKKVEKRADELNEFALQLSEREKRILKIEMALLDTKKSLEEIVHNKTVFSVNECRKEYEEKVSELEREIKDKNNEIKRMQSNFSLLKDACDKQKNRICELEKSNEQLQFNLNQSNARLKNLLRTKSGGVKSSKTSNCSNSNSSMTSKAVTCGIIDSAVWKRSKEICDNNVNLLNVMELQVNWLCEVYLEPNKDETIDEPWITTCKKIIPSVINVIITNTDQAKCQLSYLKLVYWCLHFLYKSSATPNAMPTASIHRLGEVLARSLPKKGKLTAVFEENQPTTSMTSSNEYFCSSSDSLIRLYSTVVLIKTCGDTLKLISALNVLKNDLKLYDMRARFFALRAVEILIPFVNGKSQPLASVALEIFVQLCLDGAESEFPSSMESAVVEKLSQSLKNEKHDSALLEKIMVILQKLCKVRPLKKSFDEKKLVPPLQQLWLKANNDNAFLALSVRSVLLSVGSTVPRLQ